MIPFNYKNVTYYSCIINGPNNPLYLPQCLIDLTTWSFCNGNRKFLSVDINQ